jgi:hypothetical protein
MMKLIMRHLVALLLLIMIAVGQDSRPPAFPADAEDPKLPNGKSQRQEILKAEHKKSIEDAQEMAKLAAEVQTDLEKGDANIVSLKMMKQLDEIDKLAKRIQGRLKRI